MISNEINLYHNIVWKSKNVDNIENVKIICFAENHNNIFLKKLNGLCIDRICQQARLSTNKIALLLEEPTSCKIDPVEVNNRYYISSNLPAIGWDSDKRLEPYAQKLEDTWFQYIDISYKDSYEGYLSIEDQLIWILQKFYSDDFQKISYDTLGSYSSKLAIEFNKYSTDLWDTRTQSMIDVLEYTKHNELRFVIAGRQHFIPNELNIQPFLSYLEDKNAIIVDAGEKKSIFSLRMKNLNNFSLFKQFGNITTSLINESQRFVYNKNSKQFEKVSSKKAKKLSNNPSYITDLSELESKIKSFAKLSFSNKKGPFIFFLKSFEHRLTTLKKRYFSNKATIAKFEKIVIMLQNFKFSNEYKVCEKKYLNYMAQHSKCFISQIKDNEIFLEDDDCVITIKEHVNESEEKPKDITFLKNEPTDFEMISVGLMPPPPPPDGGAVAAAPPEPVVINQELDRIDSVN